MALSLRRVLPPVHRPEIREAMQEAHEAQARCADLECQGRSIGEQLEATREANHFVDIFCRVLGIS